MAEGGSACCHAGASSWQVRPGSVTDGFELCKSAQGLGLAQAWHLSAGSKINQKLTSWMGPGPEHPATASPPPQRGAPKLAGVEGLHESCSSGCQCTCTGTRTHMPARAHTHARTHVRTTHAGAAVHLPCTCPTGHTCTPSPQHGSPCAQRTPPRAEPSTCPEIQQQEASPSFQPHTCHLRWHRALQLTVTPQTPCKASPVGLRPSFHR